MQTDKQVATMNPQRLSCLISVSFLKKLEKEQIIFIFILNKKHMETAARISSMLAAVCVCVCYAH